ncbi:NAD(P)-binding protein [Tilletiaria anomala UBC 951]|uniref:NAD(P)-binding protein n=1 Tax=Tilletiaria anomala (strain ATCC 24038 / CBS 436.72 / UBC 951) TaxID=1037660 RepID=A0A066VLF9_TILAU|nr:NAD(P)-binding protein [Tilletiaria anomala UBC 951]KDN41133.1 NAD(P)-binding protein [Tilletiaria anomala UBC 951]
MPKDAAPDQMPELGINTLFGIKGKVALVTGGGSGLGKMISAALVRNGAKVYIASRKLEELQRVAKDLNVLSPPGAVSGLAVIPVQADVSNKAGCDALAKKIFDKEKELHILINNAGLTWGAAMDDFPEQKGWDKVFDLNVKSQFYLTVALLPLLTENKSNTNHAEVINIASTAAYTPMAESPLSAPGHGTFSYQPSKAASVHLTRTLANSLAEKHVLINAICPGVFPSRMTAYAIGESGDSLIFVPVFASSRTRVHTTFSVHRPLGLA